MATIEEVVAANRRRLMSGVEGPLIRMLAESYARVLNTIERESRSLAESIAERGTTPSRSEMLRMSRLQALQSQVEEEMREVSRRGATAIREARRATIIGGVHDAQGAAVEVGVRLNAPAVERIVSGLAPGSPLQALVSELPQQASVAVRNALIEGVVLGRNPRMTARSVRAALSGQSARAMTIARTETLRAYRGAAQETYRANARNLQGWVWISARDSRTCATCWAMHGTEHTLAEPFASHPNCRCSPAPIPRAAAPAIRSGIERFRELPETQQVAILGPAKHRAYASGALDLDDLVGTARHSQWGPVRFERPLRDVLGRRRAVEFYGGRAA